MARYLGIDTSNYTTSVALYDTQTHTVVQQKKLLPVKSGTLGLKQSDAVFHHVKQLPDLIRELFLRCPGNIDGVGVSTRPRPLEGSYMPCFLVGKGMGESLASVGSLPVYGFSHQEGHVTAALFSAGRLDLLKQEFIAFHLSGGTTECLYCDGRGGSLKISILSATSDLNAGQAVDRCGVALGLSFPAGPQLEQLAASSQAHYKIRPSFVGKNPSLSGVENRCQKMLLDGVPHPDIARYVLDYIAAMLEQMTHNALEEVGNLPVLYAGGVMSNQLIRRRIEARFPCYFAQPAFSADNAVGIAILAAGKDGCSLG